MLDHAIRPQRSSTRHADRAHLCAAGELMQPFGAGDLDIIIQKEKQIAGGVFRAVIVYGAEIERMRVMQKPDAGQLGQSFVILVRGRFLAAVIHNQDFVIFVCREGA